MAVIVSLLRGVNLGKNRRIRMDALRAAYESAGLGNPQTFLQSGNVLFKTGERSLTALARRIEDAFERAFGFRSDVILRTTAELKDAMARNPFAARDGIEPAKLLVTFLAADPPADAAEKISAIQTAGEELHLSGRELYIYFPNGMGRSKLNLGALDKALKTTGTGRNWNTVTSLYALAEKIESVR